MPSRQYRSGRGLLRGLLWPDLRSSHPNYAMVILGEMVVHFGLGVTSLWGPHNSAVWHYWGGQQGFYVNGAVHLIIWGLMVAGLYSNFLLTRFALLISVTVYLLQLCLLLAGVARTFQDPTIPLASFEGSVYTIGLILLSIAAFKEPVIPGRYEDRDPHHEYGKHAAGAQAASPPAEPGDGPRRSRNHFGPPTGGLLGGHEPRAGT